jgi:hypothetical protein
VPNVDGVHTIGLASASHNTTACAFLECMLCISSDQATQRKLWMSVSHIRSVETVLFVIPLVSTTGRSEDIRGGDAA